MATVEVPSFNWASFYYGQILEALIQFKRTNVPELTNESPEEPLIQMLRAFACVGHLCNVNADIVANESTLPTAKLAETVRNMLRLIGYEMSPATPAIVDMLFELSAPIVLPPTPPDATEEIIPAYSQVSTRARPQVPSIPFEVIEAIETIRTDLIKYVFAYDESAGTFTDHTGDANSQTPGDFFTPWSPITAKDVLYIGHPDVQWTQLSVNMYTPGANFGGVWEYYSGSALDAKPDSVTIISSYLRFNINGLLGTSNKIGTIVRVQLDETGNYLDIESEWDGTNYIETDGTSSPYLGQSAPPSTDTGDYTVGTLWDEMPDVVDGTSNLTQTGNVTYTLPESLTRTWQKTSIQGIEAYWMRYRVINVIGPTDPVIDYLRIDEGKQYIKAQAVQGQFQVESNIGISAGDPSEEYAMAQENFILESEVVTVAGVEWLRVENFLQSRPTDRHYQIVLGENDKATVRFGDGTRGATPGVGDVIGVSYRYGANQDGNVGANTIIVDNSGIPFVSSLWNPRPANGWQESQGADEDSLELAKIQGPNSLRIVQTAISPIDIENLVTANYVDENGVRPFTRVLAIEEGFGPKTIELVVVPAGGGAASAEQLQGVETYLNGDRYASPPIRKLLVANQEVTATNYQTVTIDIQADVYGIATAELVVSRLTALLQPEAKQEDGVSWEWEFGEDVNISRIIHEIFSANTSIYRVDNLQMRVPPDAFAASDIPLTTRELPVAGTISITVYP